jgi:nuclear transport factor 2 (NTF2) superfamily protein
VARAGAARKWWLADALSLIGNRTELAKRKWNRELHYRLIKELWAVTENRIAVRFAYEWHDDSGSWLCSYGNENWEFDENGFMRVRHASINELLAIKRALG